MKVNWSKLVAALALAGLLAIFSGHKYTGMACELGVFLLTLWRS